MVQLASRRRIIQAIHKSWANNIEVILEIIPGNIRT